MAFTIGSAIALPLVYCFSYISSIYAYQSIKLIPKNKYVVNMEYIEKVDQTVNRPPSYRNNFREKHN
jgi:hypothetical protein